MARAARAAVAKLRGVEDPDPDGQTIFEKPTAHAPANAANAVRTSNDAAARPAANPPPAGMNPEDFKRKLEDYFMEHDPASLSHVASLVQQYEGIEDALFVSLEMRCNAKKSVAPSAPKPVRSSEQARRRSTHGGDDDNDDDDQGRSVLASRSSGPAKPNRSRFLSKDEIRARNKKIITAVGKKFDGDTMKVKEFKSFTQQMARGEMTPGEFVDYLTNAAGASFASKVVKELAAVIPDQHMQEDLLRCAADSKAAKARQPSRRSSSASAQSNQSDRRSGSSPRRSKGNGGAKHGVDDAALLSEFFLAHGLEALADQISELGVEVPEDLMELEEEDIATLNLKKLQVKRLNKAIAALS